MRSVLIIVTDNVVVIIDNMVCIVKAVVKT